MNEELEAKKPCHLLANSSGTKIFMVFYPNDSQGKRLLIPISLENVIVETLTSGGNWPNLTSDWISDNLSTVEFHAKQKGLV